MIGTGQIAIASAVFTIGLGIIAGASALFKSGTADIREGLRMSEVKTSKAGAQAAPKTTLDELRDNIQNMKNALEKVRGEQPIEPKPATPISKSASPNNR